MVMAVFSAAILSGCASGGSRGSQNVDVITFDDIQKSVPDLVDNMLRRAPMFQTTKAGDQKWYVRLAPIINNTTRHWQTDIILDDIAHELFNSGKIVTIPWGESSKDTDYIMNGKISMLDESTGNSRKKTYLFQFHLTTTDNVDAWRGRAMPIRKKGRY